MLDLGGTTTFVCNLGGELVRRGIPVVVHSFGAEHPLAGDFARASIRCHLATERRIFEDRMTDVLRNLAAFRPTVLIANLSTPAYETLRYAPTGVFRIAMAQTHDPGVYRQIRYYAGCCDLVVGVSGKICESIRSIPEFAGKAVDHIPYGVPMPEVLNRTPADDKRLRILYLGRLDREQKRVHLLPQILDELRASGIPFHWTIAGAGPEEGRLREAMRSDGAQTVAFSGRVAYADVPAMLLANDVFLLTSDYEGLPLSLLEAMGHGLVPVVSDLESGIAEVVDESTGIRVPSSETTGYARSIVSLHRDRSLLARLSAAARSRVAKVYSRQAVAERWTSVLAHVPAVNSSWPDRWKITPILAAPNPWRFHPLLRPARRVFARVFRS